MTGENPEMRIAILLASSAALASCATTVPTTTSRPMTNTAGLERVMGRTATQLVQILGQPAQDFREDGARKLQWSNDACVLDTYLYPESRGREPVATYVDARNAQGEDVDRASCVEAHAR